jgi:resuscitation-promoting factor RpfB
MVERIRQSVAERSLVKIKIPAIVLLTVIFTLAIGVVVASALSAYTVTIQDGENALTVSTRKGDPAEILEQAELTLNADDLLETQGFTEGEDSLLVIYRACTVSLIDGDTSHTITACKDVGYTLNLNSVTVGENDRVSTALEEPVIEGMTITIDRAFGVTVTADGVSTGLQTIKGNVQDAVVKAGIVLDEDDETVPPPQTPLTVGMEINVLRVEYAQRSVLETIKFKKTVKKSYNMYIGESKIIQAGVDGEKTVTYKDRIVNGKVEKTDIDSQTVTKQAKSQITLVGSLIKVSKIKFKSGISPISNLPMPGDIKLDANGIPTNYTKFIDGTAKAYSGGGTTSTGRPAMVGHIAVNPKQIPYGTRLYVVSLDGKYIYGYCIAADTGGFVKTNGCTIDIYMNTFEECYQWGHRGVRIYVLD